MHQSLGFQLADDFRINRQTLPDPTVTHFADKADLATFFVRGRGIKRLFTLALVAETLALHDALKTVGPGFHLQFATGFNQSLGLVTGQ